MRKYKIVYITTISILSTIIVIAVLLVVLTGPTDLSVFPNHETSPYLLPWPEGVRYLCVQGVRGIVSHHGNSRYAFDFYMPVGSAICAARAGIVIHVVDHYDGNGINWPNNVVVIEHEDGTHGVYAHIRKGGRYVEKGQRVAQGEIIAASGNVGNSMMPHLHFHVWDPQSHQTIPISFRDVDRHHGIPRMFFWYESKNRIVQDH